MLNAQITIIGGGIGGLTAALSLQHFGFKVSVFEQAETLGEVGAGLTLSPNANHALNFLGLESALQQTCVIPQTAGVKHYQTGEMLILNKRADTPRERYGADYLQIHRADLHATLALAVSSNDPGCIHTSHELINVEQNSNRVQATFANGQVVASDALIACDGVRSVVRGQLFATGDPAFTGYIAWRGLVPADDLPQGVIDPDSAICTGPDQTFTRYLIRRGELLNYVAVARRSGWKEEGWSLRADKQELAEEFSDWSDDVRTIIKLTPEDALYKWALFDRDPLENWINGKIALLGDAAHPMLPFMGQGAAMAIEDGLILGRCFADAASVEEALQRYQAARLERTSMVLLESRANIKRLQRPDTNNYDQSSHKNEEVLGLFDYNPATIPV